MTDDAFTQLMQDGWIAGYPPWFSTFWIAHANCKTKQQTENLLHLLRSIEDGKQEETKRLLPGINPNLRLAVEGTETESLLEWAAEKARHDDCIRHLVAAGASLKAPNLTYKLVNSGRKELLRELLQAGVDPNAGPDDESPLILACWNDADAVQLLLAAGARTDTTTTVFITNKKHVSKVSPLMVAAYAGAPQIVKLLLEAGADASAADAAGNSALDWAKISRAKAKATKVIALLEKAGLSPKVGSGNLPEPVDFATMAKRPEFAKAVELAKSLTKSSPKSVQLEEGTLPGARAFRIRKPETASALLDEIQSKVANLGCLAFVSENLYETSVPYLVLLPTHDYRQAILAFETPVGQSVDSYELIAWLTDLEKKQPFVLTHLAPDLIRARFTTPIKDSISIAKSIHKICSDAMEAPIGNIAKGLEKSRELFLWWD